MKRSVLAASAVALAAIAGTATASGVGVSSWDVATDMSKEKDLPVLLEFGTQW